MSRGDADISCPFPYYSFPVVPPGKEARSHEPSLQLSPDTARSSAQSTSPDTNSPINPSPNNMWPRFAATATTKNAAADSLILFPPTKGPIHVNRPDAPLTSSLPAAGDTDSGAEEEGGSEAGDAQQQRQPPPLTPQGGRRQELGEGGGGGGGGGIWQGDWGRGRRPTGYPGAGERSPCPEESLRARAEAGAVQTATARDSPPTTRGARLPHA